MSKKTANERSILESAYALFLEKGYRHTTMDDIANSLSMSKKTLYKYYPGKLELLSASFEILKTKLTAKVEAILENKYIPFPLKLKSTLTVIATHLAPINPELFEDLREYAPEVWEDLRVYINESAYVRFQKLLVQGVTQGFINPRMSVSLMVMLYAATIQSLLDPKFISQFPTDIIKQMNLSPSQIYDQAITIIYNGILTEEARSEFVNA